MDKKEFLSSFFILVLIITLIHYIYNQYEGYKDQKSIETYQAVFNEVTDESKPINPIIISEKVVKETPVIINNKSITIGDNENIPLLKEIEDYIGWIKIDNSNIDYPVVKAKDNEYYLDHNYQKEKSDAGAIFMDRRNLGNTYDDHTIIYGHNMKNGTMFKDLNKYLEKSYFENNKIISYKDLYNDYKYQVISAYYVSADSETIPFELKKENINAFLKRSLYKSNYEYNAKDRFLTLATCNYLVDNGRMIVHAVLVE